VLEIVSFYAFSGCCRRTHKLFELGKFHHPPTIAKTSVDARKARVDYRRQNIGGCKKGARRLPSQNPPQ